MLASRSFPSLRSFPAFRALLVPCAVALFTLPALAQIEVTATAGTTGPTSYANLRLAFAAINAGTHQGAITVDITTSPSADNNTAVLNASGSGSASYTSVLVRPTGTAGARSITGTVDAGPLIDLNGADSVTIDGRTGDGYTLTLSNQSTASSANTSTIRYRADACGNAVQDCHILGRSTGSVSTLSGNVIFGTGSSTGNDGNTIRRCTIANDGTDTTHLMTQAIVSVGSTSSLALHNSGNTVDSCHVNDFHGTGGARGIRLGNGNHGWAITNNRFYQQAPRTDATGTVQFTVIDIQSTHADAGGHLVQGNHVGGAGAGGTGTWTLAGGNNRFCGLLLNVAQAAPLNMIVGNVFTAIQQSTGAGGTSGTPVCAMINVLSGAVEIAGNTIGSLDSTGAVVVASTDPASHVVGILSAGAYRHIRHNAVGGLTFSTSGTLYGIRDRLGSGIAVCDSNTVGGTAAASLRCVPGAAAAAYVIGVQAAGDTTWLRGNTVRSLLADGNGNAYAYGVHASDAGHLHIQGNAIGQLEGATAMGLYTTGRSVRAEGNAITGLTSPGTTAGKGSYGMRMDDGPVVLKHNLITDISTAYTGLGCHAMGIRMANGALVADSNTVSGVSGPQTTGIHAYRSPAVCTGNTVEAMQGNAAGSGYAVYGLYAEDSTFVAEHNTITTIGNGSTGATCGLAVSKGRTTLQGNRIMGVRGSSTSGAGLVGISVANPASTGASVVRGNTVHTVHGLQTGTNANPRGMRLELPAAANVVEGNRVHAIWTGSTATGSVHAGIYMAAGTSTLRNNMVQLGLDSAGAPVAANHTMWGIILAGGTHAVLHNTVHIGGEVGVSGSNHTYALLSNVTGARDHRNNILWNARTNAAGSAKHFAVGVNADLTGLVSDHNCLYVTGTGGVLGRQGTTDRTTLGAWQSGTGLDGNSLSTDPGLVNVSGMADDVDLHIQYNSAGAAALNGAGATGTGVVTDFDGASRGTPPDIGADEILLVLPDFFEEPDQPSLSYWKNKGQVASNTGTPQPDVRFYTDRNVPDIYLRSGSIISFAASSLDTSMATPDTTWRVDLRFTGDKARTVEPQPVDMREPYRNYYLPWCGPNGATNVRGYGRVVYEDLYPFTDLHFYSGSGGPKLAFVVRPGGDMEHIQLEFEGQDSLTVDGNGVLHAHMAGWDFPLVGGIAYQVNGGTIIPVGTTTYLNVAGTPVVDFGMSLFSLPINPALPLVIQVGWPPMAAAGSDRGLCWSTYYGGSGQDEVRCSTTDGAGNYYVAGFTLSPALTFPISPGGQVQVIGAEGHATFLSRFGPGHALEWTNYYGAVTGHSDAFDLVVRDEPFAIYLVGEAAAGLYTQVNGSAYIDETPSAYENGFIARFAQNGALVWATYFGNAGAQIMSAAIDAEGRLLIAGKVRQEIPQPNGGQPAGAYVQTFAGGYTDGFLALFNEDDGLHWSTCVGGSGADQALAVRTAGQRILLVGNTSSSNFAPILPGPGNAYDQAANGGSFDLFITEFDLDGALVWGTHYGNEDAEYTESSQAVRMTPDGDLVIAGTGGPNLDVVEGPGWYHADPAAQYSPQILLRFSGADRSLQWATYLPVSVGARSTAYAVTFDAPGNLYVAGTISGHELGPVELPGLYYQPTPNSATTITETDGFIMMFTPDHDLAWCTYFGGDDWWGGVGLPFEAIRSLAWSFDVLYATGVTIKYYTPPDSYFPLFDPGNGAWFEGTFHGLPPDPVDGFIAAFCTDMFTSVQEAPLPNAPVSSLHYLGEGQWRVSGLPDGHYRLRLFDISGRELSQRRIMVSAALSEPFTSQGLSVGTYVVVFDGPVRAAHKVPVQR